MVILGAVKTYQYTRRWRDFTVWAKFSFLKAGMPALKFVIQVNNGGMSTVLYAFRLVVVVPWMAEFLIREICSFRRLAE
jgi:hypothetical protein